MKMILIYNGGIGAEELAGVVGHQYTRILVESNNGSGSDIV